jgi:hypothetical protein
MPSPKYVFAILAAALPLAACGSSSSSNSGTNAASTASNPNNNKALAFAQCMRSHGVSNFPDPSGGHLDLQIQRTPNSTSVNGVEVNAPAFKSAMQACKADLPNGGKPAPPSASQRAAALQFAQCMRSHGVSNFPDPQISGGHVLIQGQTPIDTNSPAFKAAQQACQPLALKIKGGPPRG